MVLIYATFAVSLINTITTPLLFEYRIRDTYVKGIDEKQALIDELEDT